MPIYDRVDASFGVAPDPSGIGSLHVMTGYVPAEYGLKSGAVIESAVGGAWPAALDRPVRRRHRAATPWRRPRHRPVARSASAPT